VILSFGALAWQSEASTQRAPQTRESPERSLCLACRAQKRAQLPRLAKQRPDHGASVHPAIAAHAPARGFREISIRSVGNDPHRRKWNASRPREASGHMRFHVDGFSAGLRAQGGLLSHARENAVCPGDDAAARVRQAIG
jgi:hypothetical protein